MMTFFTGEYECKLDAKGRLILPAKIKTHLPETPTRLYLVKGFDPNLVLYTEVEYEKIYNKFTTLSGFDPVQRKLKRTFFSSGTAVDLDSIGRFLIPPPCIAHAQLQKQLMVVGVGSTIEIWALETYHQYLIADKEEYSELARKFLAE